MNTKTTAIAAVIVVAVLAIAGISIAQNGGFGGNNGDSGETYTFEDAKGVNHTVQTPLENVSVVHKYIPVFMKILGCEDSVAGIDNTYGARFQNLFPNSYFIGTYSAPEGETMVSHGSKVILTPVTMGISNSDALKQMGIEVIYLDLTNTDRIEENLLILAKLMGGTNEIMERYHQYMDIFKGCFDYVRTFDLSSSRNDVFGLFMASSGFFQTHTSSAVKVIEGVAGKCYTHLIDPNVKDTVYFNQSNEVLIDVDDEHCLDYMFVYSCDTPGQNFDSFFAYAGPLDYSGLSCVGAHHLFALSTDTVNGALSCVSAILYAQAFGADVGTRAADTIDLINSTFGLSYSTEDLLTEYSQTRA